MEALVAVEAVAKAVAKGVVETTQEQQAGSNLTKRQRVMWYPGTHAFNYGHRGAADHMKDTWVILVYHAATQFGSTISNALRNKKAVTIPDPE